VHDVRCAILFSQPVYTIQYYGQSLEYTSEQILADKYTIWWRAVWTSFVFAAVVSLLCIVTFFIASCGPPGKQQSEDENTGGASFPISPKKCPPDEA
jgi:hypothetical protein